MAEVLKVETASLLTLLTGRHGNLDGLYFVLFRGALESPCRCCSLPKRGLPGATARSFYCQRHFTANSRRFDLSRSIMSQGKQVDTPSFKRS